MFLEFNVVFRAIPTAACASLDLLLLHRDIRTCGEGSGTIIIQLNLKTQEQNLTWQGQDASRLNGMENLGELAEAAREHYTWDTNSCVRIQIFLVGRYPSSVIANVVIVTAFGSRLLELRGLPGGKGSLT